MELELRTQKLRHLPELGLVRVARWFVFKPKIPIFQGLRLENVDIFYGHLEYFKNIWHIL
jgi:hypothetical protein